MKYQLLLLVLVAAGAKGNSITVSSEHIAEGGAFAVTCTYTAANDVTATNIKWKKDDVDFTATQNANVKMFAGSKESKYEVMKTAKDDIGKYSCIIEQTISGSVSTTTLTTNTIYVRGMVAMSAVPSEDYKTAVLKCSFFGDKIDSIEWTSPAYAVITSDTVHSIAATSYADHESESVLTLKSLESSSNFGTYICKASWTTNPYSLTLMPHLSRQHSTSASTKIHTLFIVILVILLVVVLAALAFVVYKYYKKR